MPITKGYKALVDEAMTQVTTHSVEAVLALLNDPTVQIVDIRDVRELEREGVIMGYYARVNPAALGKNLLVFLEIKLSAKQIPAWIINNDGVARIPVTTRDGFYQGAVDNKEQTITLIPYGCSKLRVVAFPLIK